MRPVLFFLLATGLVRGDEALDRVTRSVVERPAFVASDYSGDLRSLPIGVFDSGIGGLTVLEAILALDEFDNQTLRPGADGVPDFADERFLYLGDQANMPYGNYPAAGRTDFLRELILRDASFLVGRTYHEGGEKRNDKPPVKALVIACNTATASGLEDIRAAIAAWKLPVIVIGVVEAGARGVAQELPAGLARESVGVLATVGTCRSEAYPAAIRRISGQLGKPAPPISQQGSVALAGAIEGDPEFLRDGASIGGHLREDLTALLKNHREAGHTAPIRRLVLGCTHFPLITGEITSTLTELKNDPSLGDLLADEVGLIDPAKLTARELFVELAKARLRHPGGTTGKHGFFISVPNPEDSAVRLDAGGTRLDRDYQYGRTAGNPGREDTRVVRMEATQLPETSLRLLRTRLPLVWTALGTGRAE